MARLEKDVKRKWDLKPWIRVTEFEDDPGFYYIIYEVCDWTNSFHRHETYANSKEDLRKQVLQLLEEHLFEEGFTYGL